MPNSEDPALRFAGVGSEASEVNGVIVGGDVVVTATADGEDPHEAARFRGNERDLQLDKGGVSLKAQTGRKRVTIKTAGALAADRTQLTQDKDGTIALTSDIGEAAGAVLVPLDHTRFDGETVFFANLIPEPDLDASDVMIFVRGLGGLLDSSPDAPVIGEFNLSGATNRDVLFATPPKVNARAKALLRPA